MDEPNKQLLELDRSTGDILSGVLLTGDPIGFGDRIQDLTFGPENKLFAIMNVAPSGNSLLITIDPDTGVVEHVSTSLLGPQFDGLAFDRESERMYATSRFGGGLLWELDPSDGTGEFLSLGGLKGVSFLADRPVVSEFFAIRSLSGFRGRTELGTVAPASPSFRSIGILGAPVTVFGIDMAINTDGSALFGITGGGVFSPVWGDASAASIQKIAQEYTPVSDQTICVVEHPIRQFDSPSGTLTLTIYEGGASPEAGASVASVDIPASQVTTSFFNETAFHLDPCTAVAAGTVYWFVWSRDVLEGGVGFRSNFRSNSQFDNTSYWDYVPASGGWQENATREWNFRLRGFE